VTPRLKHGAYVGGKETSTHAIWRGMLARCHNPGARDYPKYGALGVRVCPRWHRFEDFLTDMGERPAGQELDRFPNPHGNYEKANARWASHSDNQKNKRTTKRYDFFGEQLTLSELAVRLGISKQLAAYRLKRSAVP
jgi:hypothetical protein